MSEFVGDSAPNYIEFAPENLPMVDSESLRVMAGRLYDIDEGSARKEIDAFCERNGLPVGQVGACVSLRSSSGKESREIISFDPSDFGVAIMPESVIDGQPSPLEQWMEANSIEFLEKKLETEHGGEVRPSAASMSHELVAHGSIDGKKIADGLNIFRGRSEMHLAREYLAGLLVSSPEGAETARALVELGVCGIHSTGSAALMSIIESGALQATTELYRQGIDIVSGEHYYQAYEGQDGISFSDLAHVEESINAYGREHITGESSLVEFITKTNQQTDEYETMLDPEDRSYRADVRYAQQRRSHMSQIEKNPDSLASQFAINPFSVCFFVSGDFVAAAEDSRPIPYGPKFFGSSDYGEFRPNVTGISLDDIPLISVPKKYVNVVTEQLLEHGFVNTRVIAIDSLVTNKKNRHLVPVLDPDLNDW